MSEVVQEAEPSALAATKWRHGLFWLLVSFGLLLFSVSSDSLWLDEGPTAKYAMQKDFPAWLEHLSSDTGGDCQMPLGMLTAWMAAPRLGTGEFQLRSVNYLWGAIALLAVVVAGQRLGVAWLPALFAIQPFFWFYMNEARPYLPQIAAGSVLLLAASSFISSKGTGISWAVVGAIGVVFLFLTTLMAPFTIGSVILAMGLLAFRKKWRVTRSSVVVFAAGLLCTLPICAYYFWTLIRGAKGAKLWDISLFNAGYVLYEIVGCGGLGPHITALREVAKSGFNIPPDIGLQLVFGGALFGLVSAAFLAAILIARQRRISPLFLYVLAVFGFSAALVFLVGIPLNKAFWARHLSGVFPFYVASLALALKIILSASPGWGRTLLSLLVAALVASTLFQRLHPRHAKEDYRSASKLALASLAAGKNVWWVAGPTTAQYYGVPLAGDATGPGIAFSPRLARWAGEEVLPSGGEIHPPDIVLISRPDVHDPARLLPEILSSGGYQLNQEISGFSVWKK